MTEGVKSFRISRKDPTPKPFEVSYEQKARDGEGNLLEQDGQPVWEEVTEKFAARGTIPGGRLLDLTASFSRGGAFSAAQIQEFFAGALVEEDVVRFERLIRDPDIAIDLRELAQITDWLMEEYGNRPTRSA